MAAPEVYCCCKRLQLCDGKYAEETLATSEVVIPDGCIVLLPGCIKDVNLHLLSIQHHFLPVTVCFSGLVVFNKLENRKRSIMPEFFFNFFFIKTSKLEFQLSTVM